jgi:hypothetical protein
MENICANISVILSRIGVNYKTGFWFENLIYCTRYIHTVRICALFKAYTGERACEAIGDRLERPCYLSRVDHNRKIRSRKLKTDIGKYFLVNRTIQVWNQLPADVLGNLSCKLSNFRKRVRKVINKVKLKEDQRSEVQWIEVKWSEVKRSKLWLNEGKGLWQYLFHDCYCLVMAWLFLWMLLYVIVRGLLYFYSMWGVYCVCSFVYRVSFDRCVILCDVCCLCVVSYFSTTATGWKPICS